MFSSSMQGRIDEAVRKATNIGSTQKRPRLKAGRPAPGKYSDMTEKDIDDLFNSKLDVPLKGLEDKFSKFSKIFDLDTGSIETITGTITENIVHTLDSENINGLPIPKAFDLVKEELQKKDAEIESLKARLDMIESIIKADKKKKYI